MFKYVSEIDIKLNISTQIIDWLKMFKPIKKPSNKKQIYREILKYIEEGNTEKLEFPLIINFKDEEIAISKEIFDEIKEKYFVNSKIFGSYGPNMFTKYYRIELQKELNDIIIKTLPPKLQDLNPVCVLQIVNGYGLLPHTDFGRKSSLFYLLTESENCITSWYEPKEGKDLHNEVMKYGFFYRQGDYCDLDLKLKCELKQNVWYVFDQNSYHSIKAKNPGLRKSLLIEFQIPAEELYNIIQQG